MGRIYLRTLWECEKHGVILRITCPACRRVVYVTPTDLVGVRIGGSPLTREASIAGIERHLRCRGSGAEVGCGHRPAEIRPLWPHEVPGLPKGVPVIPWLRADERERKRLIRIARG